MITLFNRRKRNSVLAPLGAWLSVVFSVLCFQPLSQAQLPEISIEQPAGTPLETSRVAGYAAYTVPTGLTGLQAISSRQYHTVALRSDGTVVAWGTNDQGESNVPEGLVGVQAVAAGSSHSVALRADGTVVAWGYNFDGQATVPPDLTNVKAIAAGRAHTVALKGDGSIVVWGNTSTTTIPSGLGVVKAIAAGDGYTMALKSDGRVAAWGSGYHGSMAIPFNLSNVSAIAAGESHLVALKDDGTVVVWGYNNYGQTDMPIGLSGVAAIAAGRNHTLALKEDGTVIAWGYLASTQNTVLMSLTGIEAVTAGDFNSYALKTSTVSFAPQTRFTTSAPKVFTIKNSGTAVLHLSRVEIISGNTADFTVNTNGMATALSAGNGQTSISVTFNPTGPGWRQSRLRVVNDDSDEGSFEVRLTGFSPPLADIAVFNGTSTASSEELTDNTGSLVLPNTRPGDSYTRSITIQNAGTLDDLTGLKWNVTGLNAGDFVLSSSRADDLSPNGMMSLNITFTPQAAGLRIATLNIYSNDPDESPFEINLRSNEFNPEISIEQPAGTSLETSKVLAWGANNYGQTNIPAGLTGVQAIAAGSTYTLALRSDGTTVGWGYLDTYFPANLVIDSGLKAIAGGPHYVLGLKNNGIVAWGDNTYGQTTIPARVSADISSVKALAAGGGHSLALFKDGSVISWGDNFSLNPGVPSGLSGVGAISAGGGRSLALKKDGTLVAWGRGDLYGYDTIPADTFGVQAISAGDSHTVVLKHDGTVHAWGLNDFGQATVPASLSDVKAVATGSRHSVALKQDGTVVAWGSNLSGQSMVPPGLTGVEAISAGSNHTVVLKTSKIDFGNQLRLTPSQPKIVLIKNLGSGPLHISGVSVLSGNAEDFSVDTTGMDTTLEAGNNQTALSVVFTPHGPGVRQAKLRVVNDDVDESTFEVTLRGVSPLSAGLAVFKGNSTAPVDQRSNNQAPFVFPNTRLGDSYNQSFTIKNTGDFDHLTDLRWEVIGANSNDFALNNISTTELTPGATLILNVSFIPQTPGLRTAKVRIFSRDLAQSPFEIALSGNEFSPEIEITDAAETAFETSRVIGWGSNLENQIAIPVGLSGVQAISAGPYHSLALRSDGTVVSWGWNLAGETMIPEGLANVRAVSAGHSHSLALRTDGTVVAWGANEEGQTSVPVGLSDVEAVAAGHFYSVALKRDGSVVAWGDNSKYQTTIPSGLSNVKAISAGISHTLALKKDGSVVAWGNDDGRAIVPAGLHDIRGITAGENSFALKADGTLAVWGDWFEGYYYCNFTPLTNLRAISVGPDHAAVLFNNETVATCGWLGGYGATSMPSGLSSVKAVAAGTSFTLALKASTAAFGNQRVMTTSSEKSFKIKNSGTATLHLTDIRVLGENASEFTINQTGLLSSIPSMGQTSLGVTFHPTSLEAKNAWLSISNDDLNEGPFAIALSGTGIPPAPGTLNQIPAQEVLTNSLFTFDLANYFQTLGGYPLTYSILSNSNSSTATVSLAGSVMQISGLAPGNTIVLFSVTDSFGSTTNAALDVSVVAEHPPIINPLPLTLKTPRRLNDGSLLLEFSAITGRNYQIEYSDDLVQWTQVSASIQAGSTQLQWLDHTPGPTRRYYRVRLD